MNRTQENCINNNHANSPHSPYTPSPSAAAPSANANSEISNNNAISHSPPLRNLPHASQSALTSASKQREQTDYSDIVLSSNSITRNTIEQITKENKTKILPKNISNRTKAMLKRINKLSKTPKQDASIPDTKTVFIDSDGSESMSTD